MSHWCTFCQGNNAEQCQFNQEPVAKVVLTDQLGFPCLQWLDLTKQFEFKGGELLYTSPPQRQHEPVAWRWIPSKLWKDYVLSDDKEKAILATEHGIKVEPLYTFSPQRQWVGLTTEEIMTIAEKNFGEWDGEHMVMAKAVEAKLKELNYQKGDTD